MRPTCAYPRSRTTLHSSTAGSSQVPTLSNRPHSTFRAAWALGFSRISFAPTGRATKSFSGKA
eukprot:10653603-Alexandrium_andersonii.AAC.1